ncbi:hypothetical protein M0802_007042 [Mischocyttarus mexicanus]|nr:hypothetical protein M0802_007042 [Mischocyttarus mexicanus]
MKSQDYFFNKVYQTILFGGSYYKKTRICAPTEFDIDIIIKLPINYEHIKIRIKKSGPAFTLQIHFSDNETIDVDLVPVLEFSKDPPNVDLHYYKKQNWFAVPKPLYSYNGNSQIFWRTCFYEQEKEILSKNGKIKEVIKLMKKLRDTQNWINFASYYIETLALHEVQSNILLEKKSITVLFMEMLHKLHNSLINKRITYYWDGKFNLLSKLSDAEIVNIEKRLNRIIQTIYKLIDSDEYIIASYILNPIELRTLKFQINSEQSTEHEQPTETQSRCMIL